MTYQKTPYGSNRLFLYRNEMPENQTQFTMLLMFLGTLSIWGSHDKNEDEYLSWEFPIEITEEIIKRSLSRLNCNLETIK